MKISGICVCWLSVFILVLACIISKGQASSSTNQDATAIVGDASGSMEPFSAEKKAEGRELLSVLSEGEHLIIIQVDASAKTLFDARLDAESKAMAINQLEAIQAIGRRTDLGLALENSVRSVSRFPGKKRVFLFTDGVPRPRRKSKFYGKSFEQILSDASVIPDDVEVVVRLYGAATLTTNRLNIHILRDRPDWSKYGVFQRTLDERVNDRESRNNADHHAWVIGSIVMVMIILAALGMTWAMKRLAEQRRIMAEEEQAMKQPIYVDGELPSAPQTPEYKSQVVIDIGQTGETAVLDQDHQPAVVIGGRWDADIYLPKCGDASVRIFLSANHQTGLALENCGRSSVRVGGLEVPPGKVQWLPINHIEIAVGSQILHVYQEMVMMTSGSQGGEENVKFNA